MIAANEVNLMGQPDPVVFNYASNNNCVLLTLNCQDFEALHEANPNHLGVLAVYKDAEPSKDMSFQEIVKAIANLETANIPLTNQFIALNHWNY